MLCYVLQEDEPTAAKGRAQPSTAAKGRAQPPTAAKGRAQPPSAAKGRAQPSDTAKVNESARSLGPRAGLGLDVAVLDEYGDVPVETGAQGELACRTAFPCAPLRFLGDDDAGSKYRSSYFWPSGDLVRWSWLCIWPSRGRHQQSNAAKASSNGARTAEIGRRRRYFDEDFADGEVWKHGDWAEPTAAGGLTIHGRSDATLNPGAAAARRTSSFGGARGRRRLRETSRRRRRARTVRVAPAAPPRPVSPLGTRGAAVARPRGMFARHPRRRYDPVAAASHNNSSVVPQAASVSARRRSTTPSSRCSRSRRPTRTRSCPRSRSSSRRAARCAVIKRRDAFLLRAKI